MKNAVFLLLLATLACTHQTGDKGSTITANTVAVQVGTETQVISINLDSVRGVLDQNPYLSYTAAAKDIRMYWKYNRAIIQSFEELVKIEPNLQFAMNGGMYTRDYAPVGLYVEEGKQLKGIKRYNNPKVNFGLQPQGIFLVRGDKADVVSVDRYDPNGVTYATQSAPMLVLDGKINPRLPRSKSANIRNGVGILPDGKVLMVLSRNLVTFQEFAQYFVDQGCVSALYLDGGVSQAYLPGEMNYGYFGVMIGVINKELG